MNTTNTLQPVLIVQQEPDYWSRGHFFEGRKPHIDPSKVLGLPIGTELFTRQQLEDALAYALARHLAPV